MTYMSPPLPFAIAADHDGFVRPHPPAPQSAFDLPDMFSDFQMDMRSYAAYIHPVPVLEAALADATASTDFNFAPSTQPVPDLGGMQSVQEETAFSDVVSAVDTQEPTIDKENKLLSFSAPTFDHLLFDRNFRQTSLTVTAQLHGMFFLAESPWATTDTATPMTQLTCYRRNLFQITGTVALPKDLRFIMTDLGEQKAITSQELIVSAIESTEGNTIKIISVPWKTSDDKTEKEPPTIPLDLSTLHNVDSKFAQFPFQWTRLQFRAATANNGRRKELQQHFVVHLKVVGTLETGQKITLAEVTSGPIIVRGRSPRNFSARKDTPLNATANHARKSTTTPAAPIQRAGSGDTVTKAVSTDATTPAVAIKPDVGQAPASSMQSFFEISELQPHPDMYAGYLPNINQHTNMTSMQPDFFAYEHKGGNATSSPDFGHPATLLPRSPAAPINLSLTDDTDGRRSSLRPPSATLPTPPVRKLSSTPSKRPAPPSMAPPPQRAPSFNINTGSTPDESADLLYEYFPLSIDDWMPPVDAVYRPHVVHHIQVGAHSDPRDPTPGKGQGRSKRYFSEVLG